MQKRAITFLSALAFTAFTNFAAAAEHGLVVGAWIMELNLQGQVMALELVISEADGSLGGTIGAPKFGVSPISIVAFDGENLKFETPDQQGGTVQIALKLAADKLSGNIASPMGDIPTSATRK